MPYVPEGEVEPAPLRRLRWLVNVLIVVLIVGFLAMVATIVIRLGFGATAERVALEELVLPDGAEIVVTGQGPGTLHMVLRENGVETLHIYDGRTGRLLSRTTITRR